MAERTITVCDVCGEPAVKSVSIKVDGRSHSKDVCRTHLSELMKGTRPARRGRRRAIATAEAASANKATARRARRATATR